MDTQNRPAYERPEYEPSPSVPARESIFEPIRRIDHAFDDLQERAFVTMKGWAVRHPTITALAAGAAIAFSLLLAVGLFLTEPLD